MRELCRFGTAGTQYGATEQAAQFDRNYLSSVGGTFTAHGLKEIKLMQTQTAVTDTSELTRLSFAELEASNRAYTWLMLKLAFSAIALTSAGLGLIMLG